MDDKLPLRRFKGIVTADNLYAADEWWDEFTTYLRLSGINDFDMRKDYMMFYLEGDARAWFTGLVPTINDWGALEHHFLNTFRPPNLEQALTAELTSLRQGKSSVIEYCSRFNTLRNRCSGWFMMSDTAALGVFRRGLRTDLAEQASTATGVSTVEELLPVLMDMERYNALRDSRERTNGQNRYSDRIGRSQPKIPTPSQSSPESRDPAQGNEERRPSGPKAVHI